MFEADDNDIEMFQAQLAKKGITREMLDLRDRVGLTYDEMKRLVSNAYLKPKAKKTESEVK